MDFYHAVLYFLLGCLVAAYQRDISWNGAMAVLIAFMSGYIIRGS